MDDLSVLGMAPLEFADKYLEDCSPDQPLGESGIALIKTLTEIVRMHTPEDWFLLPPGRRLDMLVAKAAGWRAVNINDAPDGIKVKSPESWCLVPPGVDIDWVVLRAKPHFWAHTVWESLPVFYSTDLRHARHLIEWIPRMWNTVLEFMEQNRIPMVGEQIAYQICRFWMARREMPKADSPYDSYRQASRKRERG